MILTPTSLGLSSLRICLLYGRSIRWEREMCNYLDWELTVDNPILSNFEALVKQDFSSTQASYPTYSLQMVSKRAVKAASSSTATPIPEPNSTTSPIPSFHQCHSSPAASAESSPTPRHKEKHSYSNSSSPMADTPSPSSSNTSLASSASPKTPIGPEDFTAKIHSVDVHYDGFSICEDVPPTHPLNGKMFAHAAPCGW
ncbi:hypothetical protein AAF712_005109 [Marasmius tenuissimus]|uniref:Uncharacterized protein n=1 Tax=Marasmius tenuissimus TaxID=585030 RepID=A0ABR3A373_9AGAR